MLVGAWNSRVFHPDWVARHAFRQPEIAVEFEFAPAGLNLRFRSERNLLSVRDDRVVVAVTQPTSEALINAEEIALRILTDLQHTPVSAVGCNIGYVETAPSAALLKLLRLADENALADAGAIIDQSSTSRKTKLVERTLNLTTSTADGDVTFHLNLHYDTVSAANALDLLSGSATLLTDSGLRLLQNTYGVIQE